MHLCCRRQIAAWPLGLLIAICLCQTAWGTSFPYGDITGTNVKFYNVTETPTKVPAPSGFPYPLFGPPSIFGDNLEFSPNDFNATSTGGSLPFTDSQLSMTIMSTNMSKSIDSILIKEGGSYSLIGGGVNTQAIVSLNVVLAKILEIDGSPLATPIDVPAILTYTNLGIANSNVVAGSLIMDNSLAGPTPINQNWTATAFLDFKAAINAADITGTITSVKLSFDNALTAHSELVGPNNSIPTTAFIDKKDFNIVVDPVPEPSALVLIFAGAATLTTWYRRKRGDEKT